MRYLVAFDIPDDATRREVGDLLGAYGLRVQRSVFEIDCPDTRTLRTLREQIGRLIDPAADSVRFYPQCASCAAKAFEIGDFPDPFEREAVFYF